MLKLVPITLKDANNFIEKFHRHHGKVVGHKFSIAASDGKKIVGVVIVGRPVSRYMDNGYTLEVNRLCTNGAVNVCSFLYAAAWRCAYNMGYQKMITYILESENGAILRAAGWTCAGPAGGKYWTGVRRPKKIMYPQEMKQRYEIQNKKGVLGYGQFKKRY